MAHTQNAKKKLTDRLKRLQGQLKSVETALDSGEECYTVLQTLASARGAINGLIGEIVEGHIREHIVEVKDKKMAAEAGEELIDILRSFMK